MSRDHELSNLQLALMRILWKKQEATVAEVQEVLGNKRKLASTTVATLLNRLEKRQLVGHRREGRQFIYFPVVQEGEVRQADLHDLTRRWFQGDPTALVSHLLDARGIGQEELARIRALLASKKKKGGQSRGRH